MSCRPILSLQPLRPPPHRDMKPLSILALCALFPCWQATAAIPSDLSGDLQATPPSVTLTHPQRSHSVLVRGRTQGGYDVDLPADATLHSTDTKVAPLDALVVVRANRH